MTVMTQNKIRVQPADGAAHKILVVPAEASLQAVYESPLTPALLRESLGSPTTWQLRNETTARKAILSPQLAPRFIAALLALGATAEFADTTLPLEQYLRRAEERSDVLTAIHIPTLVSGRVWAEKHVSRTPADEPIVSVRAVIDAPDGTVAGARLAFTGAFREHARLAPQAAELLRGKSLTDETIAAAVQAASEEVSPPDNFIGSAEYRRAMVKILTRRALESCRSEVK